MQKKNRRQEAQKVGGLRLREVCINFGEAIRDQAASLPRCKYYSVLLKQSNK